MRIRMEDFYLEKRETKDGRQVRTKWTFSTRTDLPESVTAREDRYWKDSNGVPQSDTGQRRVMDRAEGRKLWAELLGQGFKQVQI